MTEATPPAARQLARFVFDLSFDNIPAGVVHEAKRSLLNWAGCAIGGSTHAAITHTLNATAAIAGPPQARILGRRERTDISHAALINGMSAHVLDFDDTHLRTLLHPGTAVASVLAALAERDNVSGQKFLTAFVAGVEIACRVSNAVYFAHNLHWYITGTAGVFGAAAAAGKVLGLNEQQMVYALGIAGAQSAGTREQAGTMAKCFIHGRAAQNGLLAALLAAQGLTSAETAIDGEHGFIHVLAPERDADALTAGLGTQWELSLNTYKPYACGVVAHPAIEACIALRNRHALASDQIETVELEVHPRALALTGIKEPPTGLKSKWSIYHSAAVALVDGVAGEHQYSDTRAFAPEIIALRRRVTATANPALRDVQAVAHVRLHDGQSFSHRVDCVIGSAERPMSDADLENKIRMMANDALSSQQITQLIRKCWDIDRLADVRELITAATRHDQTAIPD
ncbi:MAG: MmgE/PrpD family protein [Burkholderiales bacterium]